MQPISHCQGGYSNSRALHLPRRRFAATIATLALGWPLFAAADCTMRKARTAETKFNARAMAALAVTARAAQARVRG